MKREKHSVYINTIYRCRSNWKEKITANQMRGKRDNETEMKKGRQSLLPVIKLLYILAVLHFHQIVCILYKIMSIRRKRECGREQANENNLAARYLSKYEEFVVLCAKCSCYCGFANSLQNCMVYLECPPNSPCVFYNWFHLVFHWLGLEKDGWKICLCMLCLKMLLLHNFLCIVCLRGFFC